MKGNDRISTRVVVPFSATRRHLHGVSSRSPITGPIANPPDQQKTRHLRQLRMNEDSGLLAGASASILAIAEIAKHVALSVGETLQLPKAANFAIFNQHRKPPPMRWSQENHILSESIDKRIAEKISCRPYDHDENKRSICKTLLCGQYARFVV
jgi:hypothetical protein